MTQNAASKDAGMLDVLGEWLSARSTLVLVLLMVQLGLVLALFNLFNVSAVHASATVSRGGAGAACGHYEVLFAPGAQLTELRQWALNFNAQIVAGPNARGAFEMQVPQLSLAELQQALGVQAVDVRANALCPVLEAN